MVCLTVIFAGNTGSVANMEKKTHLPLLQLADALQQGFMRVAYFIRLPTVSQSTMLQRALTWSARLF